MSGRSLVYLAGSFILAGATLWSAILAFGPSKKEPGIELSGNVADKPSAELPPVCTDVPVVDNVSNTPVLRRGKAGQTDNAPTGVLGPQTEDADDQESGVEANPNPSGSARQRQGYDEVAVGRADTFARCARTPRPG
jgi:hypothetical protein